VGVSSTRQRRRGIGFVNFGVVHELKIKAPIETFGQGARGFNVYTGHSEPCGI